MAPRWLRDHLTLPSPNAIARALSLDAHHSALVVATTWARGRQGSRGGTARPACILSSRTCIVSSRACIVSSRACILSSRAACMAHRAGAVLAVQACDCLALGALMRFKGGRECPLMRLTRLTRLLLWDLAVQDCERSAAGNPFARSSATRAVPVALWHGPERRLQAEDMPHRVAAVADQERILRLAGVAADASALLLLGRVERVRRRLGAKLEILHGDRAIGVALVHDRMELCAAARASITCLRPLVDTGETELMRTCVETSWAIRHGQADGARARHGRACRCAQCLARRRLRTHLNTTLGSSAQPPQRARACLRVR